MRLGIIMQSSGSSILPRATAITGAEQPGVKGVQYLSFQTWALHHSEIRKRREVQLQGTMQMTAVRSDACGVRLLPRYPHIIWR